MRMRERRSVRACHPMSVPAAVERHPGVEALSCAYSPSTLKSFRRPVAGGRYSRGGVEVPTGGEGAKAHEPASARRRKPSEVSRVG
jgi:hypothetical protein